MTKTQYYCASSLDGYIAETDDTIDWLLKYEGSFDGEGVEPIKGSYQRYYEGVGALVMGSATYEFVLGTGHWHYEGLPAWVFTSRDLPVMEGADIRFASGPVAPHHTEMTAAAIISSWRSGTVALTILTSTSSPAGLGRSRELRTQVGLPL